MQSFSKIEQLEADAFKYPNNIEINQVLAEAYAKEERWEEATEAYQTVVALYPAVAALNINRIRLGAIALVISSFLFLVSQILDPTRFAFEPYDFVTLPAFAVSNILFLPVLTLLSCAAISIYKLLSTSGKIDLRFGRWFQSSLEVGCFFPTSESRLSSYQQQPICIFRVKQPALMFTPPRSNSLSPLSSRWADICCLWGSPFSMSLYGKAHTSPNGHPPYYGLDSLYS